MKRFALLLLALGAVACKKGTTDPPVDPVSSIVVTPSPLGVSIGQTQQLTAQVLGADGQALDEQVRWSSSNSNVASVTADGVVRGVGNGTAQITASAGDKSTAVPVQVSAASYRTFNVNADQPCTQPQYKSAIQVATTARVSIYEDLSNPAGGPTPAQYQLVASTVEDSVYDVNVANFGAPTDIDSNGRIILLYSRAVNELTPANAGYVVGGFQYARDLFPKTATAQLGACASSNVAEMFYLLSADPTGSINGNVRSVNYVLGGTVGIVAHEFQHVINASRRLYVVQAGASWEETIWLNEGLSHIAEELTFYNASGRTPRSNTNLVDIQSSARVNAAFAAYGVDNVDRFDSYLSAVNSYGPFQDNDDLETRGATWSLLRYMADRRGGNEATFWSGLVSTSLAGLPNLDVALGGNANDWARDWNIANYTDDAVVGIPSLYTHPSWNFRSIMANPRWGGYGLQVTAMASGVPVNNTIRAGSAAYYRFGVAPAGTADLRVALGGTTVTTPCVNVTLAPGAVFHGLPATASAVCLAGGATGAEYALVASFQTRDANGESANANTSITVVGTGIQAPVAPPTPAYLPDVRPEFVPAHANDGGFEHRLRRRERQELRGMVRGEARAAPVAQADPAANGVSINIIRIR